VNVALLLPFPLSQPRPTHPPPALLQALPLAIDLPSLAPAGGAAGATPVLPAWCSSGGLSKGDVLGGDLGLLLVCLDWPG
jgi:hypothetical protein